MASTNSVQYYPGLIDKISADAFYRLLENNIEWEEGVRSRYGPTRKAKSLGLGMNPTVDAILGFVIRTLNIKIAAVLGVYLNYYRDGQDYTPQHRHPGTRQLVISLGTSRRLTVESSHYILNNGDVIIFGPELHGVPKDPSCTSGRISIAVFVI